MAKSLLSAFVTGTRAMLAVQLFVSVGAVGLAGWTLGVTNELIRERDRLQERVIQLEGSMAERGLVVPPTQTVVGEAAPLDVTYPDEIGAATAPAPDAPDAATTTTPPPAAQEEPAARGETQRDLSRVVTGLFTPAPPMRTVVLHVRSRADAPAAETLREELEKAAQLHAVVNIMPPRDPRQSGYAYFDGRQSRAAANIVTTFHDLARQRGVAAWSAQLRGIALPAQGEYTADRLDIVLPPLPAPEPPAAVVAQPPG